jgi:hypothetical protein
LLFFELHFTLLHLAIQLSPDNIHNTYLFINLTLNLQPHFLKLLMIPHLNRGGQSRGTEEIGLNVVSHFGTSNTHTVYANEVFDCEMADLIFVADLASHCL